jgi:hypothetical protein
MLITVSLLMVVGGLVVASLLDHRRLEARSVADGRPANPSVSVVVPALNEAASIGWVIENIPAWVDEVVLVDGLSADETERVVAQLRPDVVVVHQRSKGKGAALRAGFAAASGDIVVMIDADGSTDPREMGRFVEALKGGADFVKGSRNVAQGGSVDFTRLRHLGNLGFVKAANVLFGCAFTDLCYGYCAFWADVVPALELTSSGFEIEMELVLNAVKAGLRVQEVASVELERIAGESNLNAWRDGWRVLRTMLHERVRPFGGQRAQTSRVGFERVLVAAPHTEAWRPAAAAARDGFVVGEELMEVLIASPAGEPTPRAAGTHPPNSALVAA